MRALISPSEPVVRMFSDEFVAVWSRFTPFVTLPELIVRAILVDIFVKHPY